MIHTSLHNEIFDLEMVEEIASLLSWTDWDEWVNYDHHQLTKIGNFIEGTVHRFLTKFEKVNDQISDEIKELREKAGIGGPEPDRKSVNHPEGRLFNQISEAFITNSDMWQKIRAVLETNGTSSCTEKEEAKGTEAER